MYLYKKREKLQVKRFAILPKRLSNGSVIWLQTYKYDRTIWNDLSGKLLFRERFYL